MKCTKCNIGDIMVTKSGYAQCLYCNEPDQSINLAGRFQCSTPNSSSKGSIVDCKGVLHGYRHFTSISKQHRWLGKYSCITRVLG